ncbi:TerC family protein [bacterium]|nr:TerC family protein [bacterium]
MSDHAILWTVFLTVVPAVMVFDLTVLQRRAHVIALKEAVIWTGFWVGLALSFNAGIWALMGKEKALEFLTAYLIEESLSLDNMFVFILIFSYFNVPAIYQPRILHWGILGAVVMRLFFILAGVALLNKFHWMIYVFGAVLVFTGLRMAVEREQKMDPERNVALRLFKYFMPILHRHDGPEFFARQEGRLHATPLFAALLVVEASDLIFAVDSIPAVLAVSTDTFIIYTSNIFAILGLRALYFLLAGIMGLFRFLKLGIAVLLTFVGAKMLLSGAVHISTGVSLAVIASIIALSVIASLILPRRA